MKHEHSFTSPIGTLTITAEDGVIISVYISDKDADNAEPSDPVLSEALRQFGEYFTGKRKRFDLPVSPKGTCFQNRVWGALCDIPYGKTCTYGEIAAILENPKASRAVGMANNRNPLMILVPCHRVIGSNGSLTGYAGGIGAKEFLLDLEKRNSLE